MSFYAYILRCANGKYYVGHTEDMGIRLAQHQNGDYPGYTRQHRPVELAWCGEFPTRYEALEFETRIKGWSRAKKEALMREDWAQVSALARKPVLRYVVSTSSTTTQDKRSGGMSPIIILVRPQLGENIGKAARAMLNFGLTELRLVAPRDGWPNPSAGPAAAGADIVLEKAQLFETLAKATADCAYVYATTVRKRGIVKPVVTPEEAAAEIHAQTGRSAILFGPERAGLESDDVAVASTIITVPINPEFGSLNLAQAVILIAYEWSKGESLASPPKVDIDPPAPQTELDGMIAQLDAMLEAAGHFFPPDRAHIDRRTIRSILTKPGWSAQEVRTFRGMLRSLSDRVPRK
ncbi:MAG: TrmH family RNA methyltransferase [Sphingomonadaceae bacterium]